MKKYARRPLWVAGIFLLVGLGVGTFVWYKRTHPEVVALSIPTAEPDVITYSVERPSIEKASPTILPKGTKPNDPVHITLPTIGVEGDVVKVGVDQLGAIAAPTNIHQAGWFVNSVRPGEKGLSIIDGHIDPRRETAIFQKLNMVRVGETFDIQLGSGVVQKYIVRITQELPLEESASVLFSQLPNVSYQLNLITCAGTYDQEQSIFTHRVVVQAELVM